MSIILGINGWEEQGHDASACLLIDGVLKSFYEEERFTRKRYSFDSLPINSIAACLDRNNLNPNDIDVITMGWDMPKRYELANIPFPYTNKELLVKLFPKELYDEIDHKSLPQITYVPHHMAHAASSYYASDYKESAVLVLDGQGEDTSGFYGKAKNGKISISKTIPTEFSLGYFVESACVFLGLKSFDAGKLMGLAAHGTPKYAFESIVLTKDGYSVEGMNVEQNTSSLDSQQPISNWWLSYFKELYPEYQVSKTAYFDKQRGKIESTLELNTFAKDFAASVQQALENVVLHMVDLAVKASGSKNLCYSGGVALNCSANGRILAENHAENLYIQPAANDAGVSLGAALYLQNKDSKKQKKINGSHCYFGSTFTDEEIEQELKRLRVSYTREDDVAKRAAQAIQNGKVVAWFQGEMEVGPRALGHRSILANPALPEMHELLNVIKSREQWRPLAPSVLEEHIYDLFEKACISPFMLLTHNVKDEWKSKIPAIVHVDGTTRYQSVSKKTNPQYHKLISHFHKLTGIPIILNTSFNIGGEPIVNSPYDAVRTVFSSEVDYLAIGSFWVEK